SASSMTARQVSGDNEPNRTPIMFTMICVSTGGVSFRLAAIVIDKGLDPGQRETGQRQGKGRMLTRVAGHPLDTRGAVWLLRHKDRRGTVRLSQHDDDAAARHVGE